MYPSSYIILFYILSLDIVLLRIFLYWTLYLISFHFCFDFLFHIFISSLIMFVSLDCLSFLFHISYLHSSLIIFIHLDCHSFLFHISYLHSSLIIFIHLDCHSFLFHISYLHSSLIIFIYLDCHSFLLHISYLHSSLITFICLIALNSNAKIIFSFPDVEAIITESDWEEFEVRMCTL